MKVSEVRSIAKQWVVERAASLPDFAGAFFTGSVVHKRDEEAFPATSDVDVRMIIDRDLPSLFSTPRGEFAQRKFVFRGVLLEPLYVNQDAFRDPSRILGSPTEAVSFSMPSIILDPTGDLQRLHQQVSASYRKERWVRQRCENAKEMVLNRLEIAAKTGNRLPGVASDLIQQIGWLYVGTIPVAAQIPCVANLKGITLRKGLVVSREMFTNLGKPDLYRRVLEIVGVQNVAERQAKEYLEELSAAFDYVLGVVQTPFYGDFDLQEVSRPIIIDGSRELIEAGFHREMVFWILCMRNWVQNAIENDGAEPEKTAFRSSYERLLSVVGIRSPAEIAAKAEMLRQLLPEIMSAADALIDSHPDILRQG